MSDTLSPPVEMTSIFSVITDANHVVTVIARSNVLQDGASEVSADLYAQIRDFGLGKCTFDGTTVAAYVAPVTLAAVKADKRAAIDAMRDAKIALGYTHDFGGSVGVKTLQTRDTSDTVNWLTSQAAYSALVMAGQGATVGANFRAADNTTFTLSYQDGLNAILAMAANGAAIYAASWILKDRVASATDVAGVDAIDITQGWPL